ncbi:MAG: hypothetical protein OZ921_20255 [Sorangiineae bacterium]|nr:hypothetical protein [Polyangiaceae bacterium]MEB2324858.1 hypothetical protein [Sorangiineae bacterium]
MQRPLRLLGLVLVGAMAAGVVACSGGDDDSPKGGTGGSGATGGGSSTGGTSGGTCGPVSAEFPGKCALGADSLCCDTTLPVLTVTKSGQQVAPDWSCITGAGGAGGAAGSGAGGAAGSGAAGAAGGPQRIFVVKDFLTGNAVPDLDVDLYEGDHIYGQTPFASGTTKGPESGGPAELNDGELFFPTPAASVIAYHVHAKPNVAKEFYGFGDRMFAPPRRIEGTTIRPSDYATLATAVANAYPGTTPGWTPPAGYGIVAAPIRDCDDDDLRGARFVLVDGDTGKPLPAGNCDTDARYIYSDADVPQPKCTFSHPKQSLGVVINVPPNTDAATAAHKYKLQFWGRISESDAEPVLFMEQEVEVFADAVTVYQLLPNVRR